MTCPRCGSDNVNVQMVSESKLVDKRHGCLWWCFVGWWWVPFKWLFLTVPAIFAALIGHKKQRLKTSHKSVWVCQNCGHHWEAAPPRNNRQTAPVYNENIKKKQ